MGPGDRRAGVGAAARAGRPALHTGLARRGTAAWLLAGAYGLAPARAEELLDVVVEERARSTANVRARAAGGDPVWAAHVADGDFDARMDADDRWLARMRPMLVASIAGACST